VATGFQRTVFKSAFKQERARAGLTQREIADALKVAPSTVAQWESGVSAPREQIAVTLEELLDTQPGAFRMLLGYRADQRAGGVATFAEVVENEPYLTHEQRRILRLLFDDFTATTRAAERGGFTDSDDEDPQDRDQRLEWQAEQERLAQQRAEQEAEGT
jgi:transcriptional regulator with XRE-family HTH domain